MSKKQFKELISFYKPYQGLFVADLLCALATVGIALLIPLGVRAVADSLLDSGPEEIPSVLWAGLGLAALVLLQTLCTYFYDYQGHYLGAKIERDMRARMFCHCQRLSFSYYDEHTVGDLMSRITNDTLSLAEFFHHVPEDLLIFTIKFLGATAILLSVHWQTTLIILAFLPFMLIFTLRYNRKMGAAMERSRQSMARINAQAEDSLSGIRVVQSFAGEAVEEEKFSRHNRQFLEDRRAGYQSESKLYCGMDAFSALLPIAVVVFGGLAITRGAMTLADLLLFLLYLGYFMGPVQGLVNTSRLLQEGRTGFRRYRELLDTQPEIKDQPVSAGPEKIQGKIQFQQAEFRYGQGEQVFSGLDLTVEAGEYVALVGASGVGKTTLCALIPRFYQPQKGHVLLDGVPVEDIPLRTLRQNVGVVQQDVYLFTGTAAENIAYGRPGATRDEIIQAAKLAGAHEFIKKLPGGYDAEIGPHGVRISGGAAAAVVYCTGVFEGPSGADF
ncbi:ABC transporter ATP-binding protein [Acutalibacter caecimuris]|uniref:ABC transporter ATP-binding protein n=1 Tax=Acutalibacter caecimuris TaxID=3093657 RepID=UPI002AC9CC83|nr:ABC transporter ATP-binding protein [Acutalibacter sp. M00118]